MIIGVILRLVSLFFCFITGAVEPASLFELKRSSENTESFPCVLSSEKLIFRFPDTVLGSAATLSSTKMLFSEPFELKECWVVHIESSKYLCNELCDCQVKLSLE